jgi:hypothetical protein
MNKIGITTICLAPTFYSFWIGALISGGVIPLYSNIEEIRQAIRNIIEKINQL